MVKEKFGLFGSFGTKLFKNFLYFTYYANVKFVLNEFRAAGDEI